MEALGFIRNTRRYENVLSKEPTFLGRPKYLALSEVYRDDLEPALKEIRRFDAELKAQGRGFSAMVTKVDALYRRIGPELRSERSGRPVQGIHFVLTYCTDSTREDEFDKWYGERHAPELLEWGYHDTAYRYKVVDPNDPVPHQSSPYLAIYETSIDLLVALEALAGFRKQSMSDPRWIELLNVYFSGGFRQIYPRLK
jgi:hypothetical protein